MSARLRSTRKTTGRLVARTRWQSHAEAYAAGHAQGFVDALFDRDVNPAPKRPPLRLVRNSDRA